MTFQGIIKTYGQELNDILSRITDYGWNSPDNNWGGHHFKTTDGFEIKTTTIQGHNAPEGETVSVYSNGEKVYEFEYNMHEKGIWADIIKPLIDYIKDNTGCTQDMAVAGAEYIYAREQLKKPVKFSKASKIGFWSALAFELALVAVVFLIFAFVLKKYYLFIALMAVIALSCYFFNMFISKYYSITDEGISYFFNNKEKIRMSYDRIDHAELEMRRERNVEFEVLKIFYEGKKHSMRITYYENAKKLIDALSERGIDIKLPADHISAEYIDYVRGMK